MQGFLFAEEERLKSGYEELIGDVYHAGKSAKFLHCHIRSYNQDTLKPVTAILKALQDLETIAVGLCIAIEKISPHKYLKTSDGKPIFLSALKDSAINITTDPKKIYSIFKDLEMSVFRMRDRLKHMMGKTRIAWIIEKEQDMTERYVDLCMGVSRLQVALKSEIHGI